MTDASTLGSGTAPKPPASALTIAIGIGVTMWLVYRIGRGWLRMLDRKPMYD